MNKVRKSLPIYILAITIISLIIIARAVNPEHTNSQNRESDAATKIELDSFYRKVNDDDIIKVNANNILVEAEIAKSGIKKQTGLMNRTELAQNSGMLFVYDKEEYVTFWMLNTYISLDIIFIDSEHKIVDIHKNTRTNQTDVVYKSSKPVQYVLEANAGWADIHKISEGDTLEFIIE